MVMSPLRSLWPVIAAAAGLFLAWQASETLLLIFAGILLGVLLDALSRALRMLVPLPHGWALAAVCLLLGAVFVAILSWSGYALAREWDQLARILSQQFDALRYQLDNLQDLGGRQPSAGQDGQEDARSLGQLLLPDPSRLIGGARSAFTAALGMAGSALVIVMIGIFAAASPATYRDGVVKLFPAAMRARIGGVLDEIGEVLRWWLVGQMVAMVMVGVSIGIVLVVLGVPGAMLLGVQAGLINFIPYLGPFLAAVPILLSAASQGTAMLIWVLAAYVLIQAIEGYVLTPLIMKRAADVPPVLGLAALMVFGALFGAPGIAMATPLVAAVRIAVLRLYLEDGLGDPRARAA